MPEQRLQKTREAYESLTRGYVAKADLDREWLYAAQQNGYEPVSIRSFEWSKIVTVEAEPEEPTVETPWAV